MKSSVTTFFMFALMTSTVSAVDIQTVRVGYPGNVADARYESPGFGSVGYTYNIGKYEVTAGQYCEFLNKVAATDTYWLYNMNMSSACGIRRSGSPAGYTYSVDAGLVNRPAGSVTWGNAVRFANWLHNGQPTGAQGAGTTETGAYTLNGASSDEALQAVSRNNDWKWAITSEDEWYKAAYYNPMTNSYYEYPTSSEYMNTSMANYTVGHTTDVGYYLYASPFGTFDQGGNVYEWNESILVYGRYRGLRGGSCSLNNPTYMRAAFRISNAPTYQHALYGFRVSEAPEPTTLTLLAIAALFATRRNRR